MSKLKIALLRGGVSGEREVSLKTGMMILEALNKEKYEVALYDPKDDLKKFYLDAFNKKFDLVFPALHGPFGEDGKLQGMLDMINMPYLFSGCLASALAMNKYKAKVIVEKNSVRVPRDKVIEKSKNLNLEAIIKEFNFPIVIKPAELGSSVGISIAENERQLKGGIKNAFKYGENVLLEEFIKGRELTVAIMGNNPPIALPVIEIKPLASSWFDYKAKYEPGACDEICPAEISDETRNEAQNLAIKVYNAIGCKDLARVDFILEENKNRFYFLEVNTIPGMTATSLAPQAAKVAGMEFGVFLDKLIDGAVT
ncbi:D-alanine--D-alanine ligase [Candidatus Falkowbacteria bacterium]|nr:MAG: D-alanine--D-alanine ligase [Candidatus Falkowbacteria bacterium]